MPDLNSGVARFLCNESGAVTVDWVVLTGAIVGLGLATTVVVSAGVENVSEDTAEEMAGVEITNRFAGIDNLELAGLDFSDGDGGWTGGQVFDMGALGDLLAFGPGESGEFSVDVPYNAQTATLTFDLIGGDSTDNEPAIITINGQQVLVGRGNLGGPMSISTSSVDGISVQTSYVSSGSQLGGNDNWNDSVTTVTITVDDPGGQLTMGVSSGTDQSINDEYYGIDNMTIVAN